MLDSLAATQSALGQYGQATGTLLELAGLEGFVTPSLQLRLAKTAGRASSGELEAQLGKPRPPKLNAILLLALARAQFREGRLDEALSTLGQVDGLVSDECHSRSRPKSAPRDQAGQAGGPGGGGGAVASQRPMGPDRQGGPGRGGAGAGAL